ncbi:unnamed protein product [Protopolystoma xenopodis]|uniref:Uncharacterized protein n=1 Tax=Protopolystoma xenopodis TaxID=117903 RepID=A0A3S5CKV2_9PLAT|nr:unnamed protein product [Protopolystoma xenopodis]
MLHSPTRRPSPLLTSRPQVVPPLDVKNFTSLATIGRERERSGVPSRSARLLGHWRRFSSNPLGLGRPTEPGNRKRPHVAP